MADFDPDVFLANEGATAPPSADAGYSAPQVDSVPPPDQGTQLNLSLEGGLKGYGPTFVAAGNKYGVDPVLLAAVAMHETGRGTSSALLEKNNAMGISPNNGGPAAFDDPVDSINQQARTIARNPAYAAFRQSGLIADLGAAYAPSDAPNDPRNLNKDWVGGVSTFYSQMKGGKQPESMASIVPPADEANFDKTPVSETIRTEPPFDPDQFLADNTPKDAWHQAASKAGVPYDEFVQATNESVEGAQAAEKMDGSFNDLGNALAAGTVKDDPSAFDPDVFLKSYSKSLPDAVRAAVAPAAIDSTADTLQNVGRLLTFFAPASIKQAIAGGGSDPYGAAANQMRDYVKGVGDNFVSDPNRPLVNAVGGFLGGIAPSAAATLAGSVIGQPELGLAAGAGQFGLATGEQGYDKAKASGASENQAIGADLGDTAAATALGLAGGQVGGKLVTPAVAGVTWGQIGKGIALGATKNFLEFSGMNLATGEIDNSVSQDPNRPGQLQIIGTALKEALPGLALGAVARGFEQGSADYKVGSLASGAGQSKADFITSISDALSNINANSSMSPAEKVAAVSHYMDQFSPAAQHTIMAHVSNVASTLDQMNQAVDAAAKLAPTAPETAKASYDSAVQGATQTLQATAKSIEADAADDEASTLAESEKAIAEPSPGEPTSKPAEEPTVAPPGNPFDQFDEQTPQAKTPAPPEVVQPAADPGPARAESEVEQPAVEPESLPKGGDAAPVAAEQPAAGEGLGTVGPETKFTPEPNSEVSDAETKANPDETKPPIDETIPSPGEAETPIGETRYETMTRPQLVQGARTAGVSDGVIEGSSNSDLADILRTHALGQEPTSEADLKADEDGANVDPKVAQLPEKQRRATKAFIAAAKQKGGLRGVKNFIVDTRASSQAFARPREQKFGNIYINPNQLARTHDSLRAEGKTPEQIAGVDQKTFLEEFFHNQVGKQIEIDWKKAGAPGRFQDYYQQRLNEAYDAMSPQARLEQSRKYGGRYRDIDPHEDSATYAADPDKADLPSGLAEEYLRSVLQKRETGSDTEDLLLPDQAKKAGQSAQTKRLLKSVRSNKPLVRLIQDTVTRLRGKLAQLAGRGAKDEPLNQLLTSTEDLIRDRQDEGKPAKNGKGKEAYNTKLFRVDPLAVAGSARIPDDFDYFGEDAGGAELREGAGTEGGDSSTAPVGESALGAGERTAEGFVHAPVRPVDTGGGGAGAVSPVLGDAGREGGAAPLERAGGVSRPGGSGAGGGPARGADGLTQEARRLLATVQSRSETPSGATEGAGFLRPNEGKRPATPGGNDAEEREAKLAAQVEKLKDVAVPVEEQERLHGLASLLGRAQFYGNDVARDRATNNAFLKVLLEAKKWTQKHGSVDAEDAKGNGFGARAIIRNALLDEGRATARSNRLFATGDTVERPEPGEARMDDEDPAEGSNETPKYDPSEDDYEKTQEAFGTAGAADSAEPATQATPRRLAQDAIVDRHLADLRQSLTPYARRLLELWHDSPDHRQTKDPAWASKAQKEFGITREQALKDFQEVTNTLRERVNRKGLTKDDFTRIAGAPSVPDEEDAEDLARKEGADEVGPGPIAGAARVPEPEGNKLSRVSGLVYNSPDGEKDASIAHDTRGNLGRALRWAGDDRGRDGRTNAADFGDRAAQAGFQLHPEAFNAWTRGRKPLGDGSEHTVYYDKASQRVVKITHPDLVGDGAVGQHSSVTSYLRNLDMQNRHLGDDVRLEGTLQQESDLPQIVTSQPAVRGGRPASAEEVHDHLTANGFRREADGSYFNPDSRIRASDIGGQNMLARDAKRGVEVYPIDPQLRFEGGTYPTNDPAIGPERPPVAGAAPLQHERAARPETFANRVAEDDRLNQRMRDAVHGREYTPIPNDFTAAEALHALDADGVDKSFRRVMEDNAGASGLNARQRVGLGQQLMMRLQTLGEEGIGRAIDVVDKLSTYGKDLGQAVQAFALWSRLTPAGVLMKYVRLIKPAIDEARRPHEGGITEINGALDRSRGTAADNTLDRPGIGKIVENTQLLSDRKMSAEQAKPIWQRYQEATSKALAAVVRGAGSPKEKGALEEFAGRLTGNLKALLNENAAKRAAKPSAALGAEAKLGEIYRNEPEYRQAWDHARQAIEAKFADDPATLGLFKDALNRTFEAPVELQSRALKEALDGKGIKLRDLVKQWAGNQRATRDQLVKDITERMGIDPELAEKVGTTLSKRFDILLDEARKKELARTIKASGKSRIAGQPQSVATKIIQAVNLGATHDEAAYNAIADAYKLPKYDPRVAADLTTRATEIQRLVGEGREGFQTDRKVQEMLNVLANISDKQKGRLSQIGSGLWSTWYGNVLGPSTLIRKTLSEVANAIGEVGSLSAAELRKDPFALSRAVGAYWSGLVNHGGLNARSILLGGYGISSDKGHLLSTPGRPFERGTPWSDVPFLSLLNKPQSVIYRYVGRSLEAGAAFFSGGAGEARANMLAYRIAKADLEAGRLPNEAAIGSRVADILGNTKELRTKFTAQAVSEGLTGRDAKLRVAELIEQSRPDDLMAQVKDFRERATFQQEPEGVLGTAARSIEGFSKEHPSIGKFLAPFTRIVTNVFNAKLDYSPWGVTRAYRWASIKGDDDRFYQQMVKATAGTIAYAAVGALMYQNDDYIKIHGSGPKDYEKMQQLRATGWSPYTIQVGDRYFPYKDSPLGVGLAIMGKFADGMRYGEEAPTDVLNRTAYALTAVGQVLTDQSWLSNTANLMDVFRSTSANKMQDAMTSLIGRTGGAFVPGNQSSIRLLDQIFDPTLYHPTTMAGRLMSGVAFARRLNDPAINALGDPVETTPLASVLGTEETADPTWQALAAQGAWIPSLPQKVNFSTGAGMVGDRPMTTEEHVRYATESGQSLRAALEGGGLEKMQAMEPEAAQEYLNTLAKAAQAPVKQAILQEGIDGGTILSEPKPPKGNR